MSLSRSTHPPGRDQLPKRVDVPLVLNDITVMLVQHISAAMTHIFGGITGVPESR